MHFLTIVLGPSHQHIEVFRLLHDHDSLCAMAIEAFNRLATSQQQKSYQHYQSINAETAGLSQLLELTMFYHMTMQESPHTAEVLAAFSQKFLWPRIQVVRI
jgi:hypothetical protein